MLRCGPANWSAPSANRAVSPALRTTDQSSPRSVRTSKGNEWGKRLRTWPGPRLLQDAGGQGAVAGDEVRQLLRVGDARGERGAQRVPGLFGCGEGRAGQVEAEVDAPFVREGVAAAGAGSRVADAGVDPGAGTGAAHAASLGNGRTAPGARGRPGLRPARERSAA